MSEASYREILSALAAPVLVADLSGKIRFVNQAAADSAGLAPEAMIGKLTETFYSDLADRNSMLAALADEGVVKEREVRIKRNDGVELWCLISIRAMQYEGEPAIAVSLMDISKQKELEKQLARHAAEMELKNQQLEKSQKALLDARDREREMFAALAEMLPGQTFAGRYRIEAKVGEGGFGIVYKATQLGLERQVALKVFRPPASGNMAELRERFRQEGRATCMVNHPNAIVLLDSGSSDAGIPFLVMELLEGRPLSEELKERGRLGLRRTLAVMATICDVLDVAHRSGLVHRDIKPENIFLHEGSTGRQIKILDFGIAKLVGPEAETSTLTRTGQLVGTPIYMSPERLEGHSLTGAADIYSLGVMSYEMLIGEPPFDIKGQSPISIITKHLTEPPRPLRKLNSKMPKALEKLLLQTLEKEPASRPSAAAILQEVVKLQRKYT